MQIPMSGSVRDIVNFAAGTDARAEVVDEKTGATIRIDISGDDAEEGDEPFLIEHNDDYFNVFNRREAVMVLSNIRKGRRHPDMPDPPRQRKPSKRKPRASRSKGSTSLRSVRG